MLTACSGGEADYGKTITDHLMSKAMTGKGYAVEILDLEELAPVTVADSIAILRSGFEDDRNGKVEHSRGVLALARMLPEGSDRRNREAALQRTIDSLEAVPIPAFYGDAPPERLLAIPVRCRYTVSIPGAPSVTETFDFWLSPDGNTVLCREKTR